MENLVEYNGKKITKEEFDRIQEEVKSKKDTQIVQLKENVYKTRLLG